MDKEYYKKVERLVHMPYNFHHKNKSVYTLPDESGYFEFHKNITENEINQVLQIQPHLVNEWLQWSKNKRTNNGWYFTKGDDEKCFVGHYPESEEFKEINTSDEFYACAAFIKRESERIRILFEK